jgi:hypothetical protein
MLVVVQYGLPSGSDANADEQAKRDLTRSLRSGPWSAGDTWEGGKTPTAGARVQICSGHRVVYDVQSDDAIRSIHVAGTLAFAADRDTKLKVGLIKIQPGDDASEDGFHCDAHLPELEPGEARPALEVGTPERPIEARHTAWIRLVYVDGMDKQSCPAIVCCGGRMDFHGAAMDRTWAKLGETARSGDSAVTLDEAVSGWRVGDRVIVTATNRANARDDVRRTEERTIRSIDGARLALDRPLEHEHIGAGEYRGEAANLSRNVVVESADPAGPRGHTMYHRDSAGSISYAEFRHLGKQGVLGRYSLHFHLIGDSMRGSSVVGASGTAAIAGSRSTARTIWSCATASDTAASGTASFWRTAPRSTTCSTATSPCRRDAASGCRARCCRSIRTTGPASGGRTASTHSRAT